MILLLDNYDSFTHNLAQYLKQLSQDVVVYRHDEISLSDIACLSPSHIVISPGPGKPKQAGISCDVIEHYAGKTPILGVCLGHQAIAEVFGADIIQASEIMHGKTSAVVHDGSKLFAQMPSPFQATRYHSLTIDPQTLPDIFDVTAWVEGDQQQIMAIAHVQWPLFGVQFHPESILTEGGLRVLGNFVCGTSDVRGPTF